MTYQTYTHKFIVKNSGEVLENASLHCQQASDKIHGLTSLGATKHLTEEQSRTILVPSFINLHCHLAYSKLKLKSQSLFPWLQELYTKTFLSTDYSTRSNVLDGIDEILKYGTGFVVENCFSLEESFDAISEKGIKALIGVELFGSDPQKAQEILQERVAILESYENKDSKVELCLSPHAVYDVSPELWQKALNWSKSKNKILLSHIAESPEEEIFMSDFEAAELDEAKSFWQSIKSLDAKKANWRKYSSSVNFLKENNLGYENLVLAHAVQCSNTDLEYLAQNKIKLINCPRSNEFLKNGEAEVQKWLDLKIDFAMGTDSKASNQNLDLREELKCRKELSAKDKFNKLTIDAAKLIGKDNEIGSLETGKSADFVVLELIDKNIEFTKDNILDLLLDNEKTQVKEVYVNNKRLYRNSL